jgi:hypothetical protein
MDALAYRDDCLQVGGVQKCGLDGETMTDFSTELGSDDGTPLLCHEISGSDVSAPIRWEDVSGFKVGVRFADEVAGGSLEEVHEVEDWRELTRFTAEDVLIAEGEWHKELLAQLEDVEARSVAFARLDGTILQLALDPDGCEVVHAALAVAQTRAEQQIIAENLWWHVHKLVVSCYGIEVLLSCIEHLDSDLLGFIVLELAGNAPAVACMEEGHRLIKSLLEFLPVPMTISLVVELLNHVVDLACNSWANSVVEQLLEEEYSQFWQEFICKQLAGQAARLASDKRASRVVQKAIRCAPEIYRNVLLQAVHCGSS